MRSLSDIIMKILVFDEWLPSVCNSGKSIRTFRLLAPLAKKHEILYLVHSNGEAPQDQIRKMEAAGFEVVCVPRPKIYATPAAIALGAFPALFDPLPISVRRHYSVDYAETVKKLVRERSFDLVHVEWSHYAVYGRDAEAVPRFICTHNVEYLSWRRSIQATGNPLKKLLGLHEAFKMFRFEKKCYREADFLSVVSEDDARLVRDEFGIDEVGIVPNGVEIAPYDEIPNTPIPGRLVYCGSMDAGVNQDAVAWFIKDIFPLILKKRPETTFTVIGRHPPDFLLKLQTDRIRFTGSVDDVRVPLKEGLLEVVPLRIAGGSRLKILEAFAARVPVVSTTIGAEGLNVENGRQLILADSPSTFADRCVELFDDPDARNRLTREGRQLVDEQYDWSRISPMVEAAWMRTLERAR